MLSVGPLGLLCLWVVPDSEYARGPIFFASYPTPRFNGVLPVADAVRNISLLPAQDHINYVPDVETVASGDTNLYRQHLHAGDRLVVKVTPISGDPDLYVWPSNWHDGSWSSIHDGLTIDRVDFIAPSSGMYQIEIYGNTAADYQLSIMVNPETAEQMIVASALSDKQSRTVPIVNPLDTPSNSTHGVIPLPPASSPGWKVFLPTVLRHQ
jgi:hypothetical protein